MTTILIRYWAGAKAAAGIESERIVASTVAAALEELAKSRSRELDQVIQRSSLLLDGAVVHDRNIALVDGQILEILPPFAGGAQ
ncbi:MAG TPA: MoaD/ThiS family protein [Candidatus Nanopelagicaceae bacterium]|nr:MoaD/ThiS family protein [Candidatus Nanopelagicaceae bacterium]